MKTVFRLNFQNFAKSAFALTSREFNNKCEEEVEEKELILSLK